jgi:hypothetical protein
MNGNWKASLVLLPVVLVLALALMLNSGRSAPGDSAAGGVPRHTVVATDGTHLVVTDNKEGKVYFYAIEREGKPGDEMKLRGSVDLNEVGKPSIKPTTTK